MKTVIIQQRILPHYRIPFFEALYTILKSKGVNLKVVYGKESPGTVPRSVITNSQWAVYSKNYYFDFLGFEAVLQLPKLKPTGNVDLIIVEQANKFLSNYYLYLIKQWSPLKVAFWGHGKNYQSTKSDGFLEHFKRKMSTTVDWWFTYTKEGKGIISNLGFKSSNITVTENSIDTKALKISYSETSIEDIASAKLNLKLNSDNIAIYCGGMYDDKKIQFLIESCELIKSAIPDFQIIFIGEGPDDHYVEAFSKKNHWAHYLGAVTGENRVPYFSMSKVMLMPGLVGLAVLDSFALEVPMISTKIPIHSPEFSYLENEYNGLITKFDSSEFSESVVGLLRNEARRLKLVNGCKESSNKYTIDNMAKNFSNGIMACLKEDL